MVSEEPPCSYPTLLLLLDLSRVWQVDVERGESHVLNRYWTRANTPRPESFREDLHNAMQAVGG